MKKKILCSLLINIFIINSVFALSPKREWRSTWLATVSNIDWPSKRGTTAEIIALQKKEMLEYLDGLAAMNMNAMCFQIRPMSDAFYKSSYEPWSYYLTGERGKDPGWDPLAFVAEECHKRGMDCYVWINPYRWSNGSKDWNTEFDKKLKEDDVLISGGDYTYLNPGLPEVRQHIVNVCKEIITQYDVQGMIFDDYFYPSGVASNSSATDYHLWQEANTDMSFGDWRRANVDLMVKNVYDMVQECRPDLRFGISPANAAGKSAWKYGITNAPFASNDWQYDGIYSDPLSWLNSGTIDFISPQEYVHTDHATKPFEPLTDWWDEMATHFGRHHYCSLSVSCLNDENTQEHWDEHVNQTLIARNLARKGIFGACYFSTRYLNGPAVSGAGQYFKQHLFSHKALNPIVDWKQWKNYNPVSNVKVDGGSIKWDKVQNGNAIIRYTVYAVPQTVSYSEAMTSDGLSNEYLLGVSFDNQYALSQDVMGDYWYAVCIYDGYGHESRPSVWGYKGGVSNSVTLLSPTDNANIDWECTFSWTAAENAKYRLEIASDASFSKIVYYENEILTNSLVLNTEFIEGGNTYFWRVIAIEQGKLEAVSESASFVSAMRSDAAKAQLLSPNNNAEVECMVELKWVGDKNAEKYTVEIATDEDFKNIVYSTETSEQSISVPAIKIDMGTRYWRVTSEGVRVNKSVSDTGVFNVVDIGVGYVEEGYEVKKDAYKYQDIAPIAIENLWMRSVKDDFANISFVESGKMNRDFVAKGRYVYIADRENNNKGAKSYLKKYHSLTGEHVGDILISNLSLSTYSCNTVTKDSRDNVCVANMSTRIDSVEIYVNMVDVETGKAKLVATLTSSVGGRVDYISVYGDVLNDCFYVFAALKSTKTVVRWTVRNGVATDEVCTLKSLYPTSSSTLATAPKVIPIDENKILVDGSSTYLTCYDFATGNVVESFAQKYSLLPSTTNANGAHLFTLNNKKYLLYGYDKNTIKIASIDNDLHFSSLTNLWTLPQSGMGDVHSGTYNNPSDYTPIDHRSGIVYVYVPGNGIAAYLLTDTSVTAIDHTKVDDRGVVEYFDLLGNKVKTPFKGIYIKKEQNKVSKVIL